MTSRQQSIFDRWRSQTKENEVWRVVSA